MKTKVNTLKLNATWFNAHKEGRYVKRYFFSNGLGASVASHSGTTGDDDGYFEIAILKYKLGADPETTSQWVTDHPIQKRHKCVDIIPWLDFGDVDAILKEIRNYNTGDYNYNVK